MTTETGSNVYPGDVLREAIANFGTAAIQPAPNVNTRVGDNGMTATARLGAGWLLGVRLVQNETGAYGVVEMTILAEDEDATTGLTTSDLRAVALGQIIDAAREHADEITELISEEAAAYVNDLLDVWRGDARRTGARRDRLAYAALAARYAQLVTQGDRKPAETLGTELGMSPITVSQRVREARKLGLLTSVPAGKAGGRLTPEALHLLQEVVTDPPDQRDDENEEA